MSETANDKPKLAASSDKPKLSTLLFSISNLLMEGSYPGSHASLIVQAVGVLNVLAEAEEKKELEAEEAEKPKLEVAEEVVQEVVEESVYVEDGV